MQRTTGESFRHIIGNPPGDGHTYALVLCAAFSKEGASLSAVLIKLRAGHNETGHAPHREQNSAKGVMGAPSGFLSSAEERAGRHCGSI